MRYFAIKSTSSTYFSGGKGTVMGGWKPNFTPPDNGVISVLLMNAEQTRQIEQELDKNGWQGRYVTVPVEVPDGF